MILELILNKSDFVVQKICNYYKNLQKSKLEQPFLRLSWFWPAASKL